MDILGQILEERMKQMNKIILDNSNIIELNVNKDTTIDINKDYNINSLNINILDNTSLIINHYNEINNNNLNINIKQNNNSNFIYNHSFINKRTYNLNINIKLLGNNSKNIINIKGISDTGHTNIIIDGKVNELTKDNLLEENIKMLNINEGKSNILPNMYINTKNVLANHACAISDFNKEHLFYLNSKGINDELGKKLIINGFLENSAR